MILKRPMEDDMSPLTLLIVKRSPFQKMLPVLIAMTFALSPLLALADEDPCQETGIYIGNQTGLELWYTRNGGDCTLWAHHHILMIGPKDKLVIFKDLICKTEYCPNNPTYQVYKSLDANQNCRMRILPNCALSDM
jgi:hypothetical protein